MLKVEKDGEIILIIFHNSKSPSTTTFTLAKKGTSSLFILDAEYIFD